MAAETVPFVIAGIVEAIDPARGRLDVGGTVLALDPRARLQGVVEGMSVIVRGRRAGGQRIAEEIIRPTQLLVVP